MCNLEEDYTRLWVKQVWSVYGREMRMFKWTSQFRRTVESPIVPIWVSFPYLPVHFVRSQDALFSIAAAIGTPLRVDQATASLSQPSVAKVLVEYDIT